MYNVHAIKIWDLEASPGPKTVYIILEPDDRKSFGDLGVYKNEENHALSEPKNEKKI